LVIMDDPGASRAHDALNGFRTGWYDCLTKRADALFELGDAVLCAPGPVRDLAHLSLAPVHRRGHGGLYDGLNSGRIDLACARDLLAGQEMPKVAGPDGRDRLVLAVDVSNWLRPDAATSPDRLFCHTYPRGQGQAQMIPGWPYSFVAALETGPTSWTAMLDATRLGPDDDLTTVTATQLRSVIGRLTHAGHHCQGDPEVLVVLDAGYDVVRLAWLLQDLPVSLVGRVRSDRVFHAPAGQRQGPTKGRPPRHGARLKLNDRSTWPAPDHETTNTTERYGTARTVTFERMHQRVTARAGWEQHPGQLPVIEGTLLQLTVDRLPGDRDPKPVWLWSSTTATTSADIDHWWAMYLRRFDLEHTFRMLKQTLGWTTPMLRNPATADTWTWLVLAAHTQLRLARPIAADHRLPWQRPARPGCLTPARVRRDFRNIHQNMANPASAPKLTRPGPGRPPGTPNRTRAPRPPVGKKPSSANLKG
jgi:hypothetical protein